ncbi:MAG: RNA-binding S4 domain-containing protein [Gemmatimonadales bacterium]
MKGEATPPDRVRLDKWLWAARFYKTRGLAVEAIDGGKVQVAGDRVKRARLIRVGEQLRIRQGPYEHVIVVRVLSERRGPAPVAAKLYQETPESLAARERLALQLKDASNALIHEEKGRPTKRHRRQLDRLRGRDDWSDDDGR